MKKWATQYSVRANMPLRTRAAGCADAAAARIEGSELIGP
jgi:hypothetical protein